MCSFPNCNKRLSENGNNIGQICHIVAQSKNGPRGDFPCVDLDSYDNLILLCQEHHKLIDDYPEKYPVDPVKKFKNDHETMVRNKLNHSNSFYNNLIVEFEKKVLEIGFDWLETLPNVDWSLQVKTYNQLYALTEWIDSRDWVENNDIQNSFKILSFSIKKALSIFEQHMTQPRNGYYFTDKFYKQVDYYENPELREKLQKDFDDYTYGLINITIEVANNFNTIFRLIRQNIDNEFLSNRIIPTLHGKTLV